MTASLLQAVNLDCTRCISGAVTILLRCLAEKGESAFEMVTARRREFWHLICVAILATVVDWTSWITKGEHDGHPHKQARPYRRSRSP